MSSKKQKLQCRTKMHWFYKIPRYIPLVVFLCVMDSIQATQRTFHYPPPDFQESCENYWNMKGKGLEIKAQKFAEKYRAQHLDPIFKLKPGQRVTIRITIDTGFASRTSGHEQPEKKGWDYHIVRIDERSLDSGSPKILDRVNHMNTELEIRGLTVPQKHVESWQDLVSTGTIFSELTFEAVSVSRETDSIFEDCFDNRYFFSIRAQGYSSLTAQLYLKSWRIQKDEVPTEDDNHKENVSSPSPQNAPKKEESLPVDSEEDY